MQFTASNLITFAAGINEACLQFVYFGLGLWLANIMNSIGTRNAGKILHLLLYISYKFLIVNHFK